MIDLSSSSPLAFFRRHTNAPRGTQIFKLASGPLGPRPIEPSCIEEGNPVARCTTFTESPDKRLASGLWECTAGKFEVAFDLDEIVHILEGEVTVREDGTGAVHELHPGDAAYFPLGLVTHWHVPHFVRKFFVVRVPGGSARIARARQRLGL
ncbi:MAG TPA: cupin domain-containing protein [Polyangiaceae bacterium]|nr:cupin domain-containing protein [Polyangiaceae bacterium]